MYQIYKDSEMYKFLSYHLFGDRDVWQMGRPGYNFCNYTKDIAKAVGACVIVYGFVAYCAIFGLAPWGLWMFWDYPLPMEFGPGLLSIASVLVAGATFFGLIIGFVAALCVSADATNWNGKLVHYVHDKWEKTSIGDFCSTAYRGWKDKYCPLVEVINSKENENVD